ncbi:50S ribosomal protein L11 methyltransferase [Desulfonema magnum]|uniref:Ribosomal protein methyltransferase domain-containing protein n=1 Tax=Desulfonema magnum TaxID=45655 RepID=A0A975GP74_9BACT|nr:50S ribosomal protein L11 methyltransferase [Desulfonema magnum]QTA88500.1 Ribosomal protein methyltransferase domain-containing protein [Desulfonema magnum]
MIESENPYKDLYIYYIEGRVKSREIFGTSFIGNWEEDGFSFLFFSEPSHDEVKSLLNDQPELSLLDQFHMTYDEWQGGEVRPFTVGNFLITPPWFNSQIPNPKSQIILDPGVVFGTGTHPTTYDCLDMLERVCAEERIESAIDLGTGTGLLALAAARLGCGRTLAVDFNFLAVKTAKRNVELNRLEHRILAVQGRAEDFMDWSADLMIANIHYDIMRQLINSKGFLHKKWFILSGLLRSEARDIACKLSQLPVKILKKQERDGVWHTFFGRSLSMADDPLPITNHQSQR